MRFINRTSARPGASFAMAVALLCGTAVGAVALEAPAFAMKEKEKKAAAPKLSKGFEKVYGAFVPLVNSPVPDEAALRGGIPALLAAVSTDDDKDAAGNVLLSIGGKFDDYALQIQGLEMMLESGKNADRLGLIYYNGFQLHSNLGDMDAAREWAIKAAEAGYTFEGRLTDGTSKTVTPGDLRVMASELYFDEDRYEEGLADLYGWVNGLDAAGQPIQESWLRKGFATAFNNQLGQQTSEFGALLLKYYPSPNVWADSVVGQISFMDYDDATILDVLRLARRTGVLSPDRIDTSAFDAERVATMREQIERLYFGYAEESNEILFPNEVNSVLKEGVAKGILTTSDVTVSDVLKATSERLAENRSGLADLERDARAGSKLLTVIAAAESFFDVGDFAKAEEFYAKALTLPGVDMGATLTRLGIAQLEQGKADEAIANFSKIEGMRQPLAGLWIAYARQQGGGA
jgi:tetratricopeptide (TPR) repeat protein